MTLYRLIWFSAVCFLAMAMLSLCGFWNAGGEAGEHRPKFKRVRQPPTLPRIRGAIPSDQHPGAEKTKRSQVTFSWDEPSTTVDGEPARNLAKTRLYRVRQGRPRDQAASDDVSATSPEGGGVIRYEVDLDVPEGEERVIDVWATAFNTQGDESNDSNHVVVHVDRLPPAGPQ